MTTNTSTIQSIDYEGRGIARINGKTTFIRNALPLETVVHRITRQKKQFDEAETIQILTPSNVRTQATCVHYGDCGGCALQHARFDAQVAFKQRIFEEQLQRIGKLYPEQLPLLFMGSLGTIVNAHDCLCLLIKTKKSS